MFQFKHVSFLSIGVSRAEVRTRVTRESTFQIRVWTYLTIDLPRLLLQRKQIEHLRLFLLVCWSMFLYHSWADFSVVFPLPRITFCDVSNPCPAYMIHLPILALFERVFPSFLLASSGGIYSQLLVELSVPCPAPFLHCLPTVWNFFNPLLYKNFIHLHEMFSNFQQKINLFK